MVLGSERAAEYSGGKSGESTAGVPKFGVNGNV
jgi:hypothetical protein